MDDRDEGRREKDRGMWDEGSGWDSGVVFVPELTYNTSSRETVNFKELCVTRVWAACVECWASLCAAWSSLLICRQGSPSFGLLARLTLKLTLMLPPVVSTSWMFYVEMLRNWCTLYRVVFQVEMIPNFELFLSLSLACLLLAPGYILSLPSFGDPCHQIMSSNLSMGVWFWGVVPQY